MIDLDELEKLHMESGASCIAKATDEIKARGPMADCLVALFNAAPELIRMAKETGRIEDFAVVLARAGTELHEGNRKLSNAIASTEARYDNILDQTHEQEKEIQKLRALLKRAYESDAEQCFVCYKFGIHEPDCELAAAISSGP